MKKDNTSDQPSVGVNPAAAGLATLIAEQGGLGSERQDFSEAMILGIGGGLGAGVFSFRYEKEDVSTFFVAGRHSWHDDLAFVRGACDRLGLDVVVRETAGAKAAGKNLVDAVADGRSALVWVDMAGLPYRSMPAQWEGGGYHVVVVHEVDEAAGTATISDLAPDRIVVPLDVLNASRARIRKHKNRVLTLQPPEAWSFDWQGAVGEGLSACRDGLLTGRMKNFTLQAFESWADRLAGNRSKDGWERLFPPGKHLWMALSVTYDFIEHYGSGGGLLRPLFGEFLAETGDRLGQRDLATLGKRYEDLGEAWSDLARAALPDGVDEFRRARELYDEKARLYREQGDAAAVEIRGVWDELHGLASACATNFPLDDAAAADLRLDLQNRLRAITIAEREALDDVGTWLETSEGG